MDVSDYGKCIDFVYEIIDDIGLEVAEHFCGTSIDKTTLPYKKHILTKNGLMASLLIERVEETSLEQ